jgi:hypothetical protein
MVSLKDSVRRILRNAFCRFRHVPPRRIQRDIVRAIRLHFSEPALRAIPSRPERLVVGLTTIPQRASLIRPVLRSLLDQTCPADRIILAWPEHSLRDGMPYPEIPALPSNVEVMRCDDQGPATKFLPILKAEPSAAIVAVDDDVVYPVDFLETLLAAHRDNPHSAWGWRGWRLRHGIEPRYLEYTFATGISRPVDVDVLFGHWGYLIPPGALDEAVHDFGERSQLRWVDDIWISGHLARRGIPRRVVAAHGLPIKTTASAIAALCKGINRSGENERIAVEAFRDFWQWLGSSDARIGNQ